MKKLLVLSLVLAVASLATAELSYSSGVLTVSGTLSTDYYLIVNTDATINGFAAGAAADVAGGMVGMSGDIATFQGAGVTGLDYANGEGWSMASPSGAYWPKTGTFLTANLSLDAVLSSGTQESVVGSHTNQIAGASYIEEEVVAGGKWVRTFNDVLNQAFNTVLTESFNQLGANVVAKLWSDVTPEITNDFGTLQVLGAKVIGNSSTNDVLSNEWTDKVMLSEVFVAVPEPMTMVLLGLGGLFLRKRS